MGLLKKSAVLASALLIPYMAGCSAWAHLHKEDTHENMNNATRLAAIERFDVQSLAVEPFSPNHDEVPPELIEYVRYGLVADKKLPAASPGDGVIHFYCQNYGCSEIRTEVSLGQDGDIIWRDVRRYKLTPVLSFHFLPDAKKFATSIVNKLAQDYNLATHTANLKASSKRIEPTE